MQIKMLMYNLKAIYLRMMRVRILGQNVRMY